MKLFILIFTILIFMISCADVLYEEEAASGDKSIEAAIGDKSIEGFWFACEFGSEDTDCMIFDDDGLQFTEDGEVYYIQEYTQMSEEVCDGSPCFDHSIDTITVERFLVCNYTITDTSLFLTDSLDNSCDEPITWNDDISFFIGNRCLGSQEPYMKKYTGLVVIQ